MAFVQEKTKAQYLTQAAKEEADKNLTFYTSDWKSNAATNEAKQEQARIQQAISRGERAEVVEGARMGARKTLTTRDNARIKAENERRQREYEAAVAREQQRYEREMAAYNAAVKAEKDRYARERAAQQLQQSSASSGGKKKSGNEIRKIGRKIGKIFGW